MTKKKFTPKKSVSKKSSSKIYCCTDSPNFLMILLAGTIIAFALLFEFL
ncbi:MAG: hypothetical protein PHH12_01420 [Candidatus Shapirobacteria bacterium]|nr:hypothetical protein [Candidatus Shapirobacteria bacterium]